MSAGEVGAESGTRETVEFDAGKLAGVVHLLAFAGTAGLIVAIVLWVTHGKQAPRLGFQCAQAVIVQGATTVLAMLFSCVTSFVWIAVIAATADTDTTSGEAELEAWPWLALMFGSMGIFILLFVAAAGISVYLAVRCFQGHNPSVPGIGDLAERMTARPGSRQS